MSTRKVKASSLCRRLHGLFTKAPTATADAEKKVKKLQKVVEKFKRSSENASFRGNRGFYNATVLRLASAKQFSMIEDILEHQKKYQDISDEGFLVRLIRRYGKVGMLKHAHNLFNEMPNLKCERTVKSFNALLSAYVDAKQFDVIKEVMQELQSKLGIEPNLISYNIIIKAFCEMGSLDSALSVVDELEKQGLKPDVVTFNTLLEAFYGGDNLLGGDKIWALMESKNVIPDVRSYNPRLRGLVSANKIIEAVELLKEMGSKGIMPDVFSYNAVIKGYYVSENVKEAKRWYYELKKNGCSPNGMTYGTLVPFLCKKHEYDMALELCKEAINSGVLTEAAMVQPVIDGLVEESRVEEAVDLVQLGKFKNYFHRKPEIAAFPG